jgi:uncharacterized membrane protein YccF (DUF307 family)
VRLVLNVIWFVLAGLWMANFKLIPVMLTPFGRDILTIEEAERRGLAQQVAVPSHPGRP